MVSCTAQDGGKHAAINITNNMREIKFRIWDKELKRYDSPNVHHLLKNDGIVSIVLNMDVQKISGNDRFIIQQYTGLKDKNGKEIYEGDIIAFGSTEQEDLFEVVWDEDDARFVLDSYGGRGCWLIDVKDREIIGNIFENPELLEK